jgi:outer membrane receptor protein involved in Fe transport
MLLRKRLLSSTVVAGAALIALPAFAQATPAATAPAVASADTNVAAAIADPAPSDGGAIVVTGSRISQPNLTSSSPITAVSSQEIKMQGATRIEDVLNSLPQSFATQSSSTSNGSNGTATANLRNLGDQRTLVLVNGRRLTPGDPASKSSAADLNMIPSALIKRVDVLTGGASSVYGSDAVGGVVNFVLDTNFTGLSVDANYGLYNHNNNSSRFQNIAKAAGYPSASGNAADGGNFDVNLKAGAATKDGRGHIVVYGGYRKINPILQGDRDYSACGLAAGDTDYACGGSATAYPSNFSLGDAVKGGPATNYTLGANGQLVEGRSLYNANPQNYYQRPDERYTAGAFVHYDVSDAFRPYGEFMFMRDRTVAQIAPSGDFNNTDTINCNNPLLSAEQVSVFCRSTNLVGYDAATGTGTPTVFTNPDGSTYNKANLMIGRRNIEGGARQADLTHTSYRAVLGAKGDVAPGISYDLYGQYGVTTFNEVYRNEWSKSALEKGLDVITGPNGQPTCRSVIDGSDPNCVPINLFTPGQLSQQALNYVQKDGYEHGHTKELVVSGSVTVLGSNYGIKTPWADDGLALNIGGEYRKESLSLKVDQAFATGDLTGQGGPTLPVNGQYNVKEFFAELQVPLVSDRKFIKELSLTGGYRFSSYSTAGSVSSYKGELVWAPVSDIKFRGGYNRAVRAPNVQELFAAQSVQIDGATDPCAGGLDKNGTTVNGWTAAQCAHTGLNPAKFGLISTNPSEQYNGLVGGNPNLKPEKADTFTAGIILQPSFLRGFNATIDAFRIKVKDIIGTLGADTIISQCLQTGDPTMCNYIHRDANGSLWQGNDGYITDINVNAGSLTTQGIDFATSYSYRTAKIGTFSFNFQGTYVDKFESNKAGAKFNCAGLYGPQCLYPQSKWRHTARLTWASTNGISLSGRWRYLSGTRFEKTTDDSDLAGSFFPLDSHIKAQNYFDLTASARVADRATFRIGANNLMDRKPPILSQSASPIGAYGNGNTYPGIFDASGRYIFVGVTIDM